MSKRDQEKVVLVRWQIIVHPGWEKVSFGYGFKGKLGVMGMGAQKNRLNSFETVDIRGKDIFYIR